MANRWVASLLSIQRRKEKRQERHNELVQRAMRRAALLVPGLSDVSRDQQIIHGCVSVLGQIFRLVAQAERNGLILFLNVFFAQTHTLYSATKPEALRPLATADVRRGPRRPPVSERSPALWRSPLLSADDTPRHRRRTAVR